VFPKKPYKVGGCMTDHTQTTGSTSYQGRVCPTTTSLGVPGCVDTLVSQVYTFDHQPTGEASMSKQNTSMPCVCERAGQWSLYHTYEQPTTVICNKLYGSILAQVGKSGSCACGRGLFIPLAEARGLQARLVKTAIRCIDGENCSNA